MDRNIEKTGFLAFVLWNFPFSKEGFICLLKDNWILLLIISVTCCLNDIHIEKLHKRLAYWGKKEQVKNIAFAFLCALDTEKGVGRTSCKLFCKPIRQSIISTVVIVAHCSEEKIFKSWVQPEWRTRLFWDCQTRTAKCEAQWSQQGALEVAEEGPKQRSLPRSKAQAQSTMATPSLRKQPTPSLSKPLQVKYA